MSDIVRSSSQLRVDPKPESRITKSDRTRAAILNAALDFIWSRPFREMSVRSLMGRTDISRPTFYQYFTDIHDLLKTLLDLLADEIFVAVGPWLEGVGDPVALMNEMLEGLIRVCYRRGPFLRAISDAATTDKRFEKDWTDFLGAFDDAASVRIEADQEQGLIPDFPARPVAVALNRLDAYTIIEAFGQRPRNQPEPVHKALARIWISTLYGTGWVEKGSSDLTRK